MSVVYRLIGTSHSNDALAWVNFRIGYNFEEHILAHETMLKLNVLGFFYSDSCGLNIGIYLIGRTVEHD